MLNILTGTRIIDLTTVVLGPFASQYLGDFGAEVIKVESIHGDMFRAVRPGRSDQMGAGFVNCNRNKESIALDLKSEQGKDLFLRLVKTADVVIHNMRNKTAHSLGIAYADLKSHKPDIVYCCAQGFGSKGPDADVPAYDDIIQAASGLAFLNADKQGNPQYLQTIIADKVSGLQLAIAVLGGIIHKYRTGKGSLIESPMFEGLVSFLMAEQMAGLSFVPSIAGTGYERLSAPYRRPYPTADGYIALLPYSTKNWIEFFTMVNRPELAALDIVLDPIKRSEHINELYKHLYEITPQKTTDQWCALLKDTNIPHTRVNKLDDLLTNEHLQQVGLFEEYTHPSEGLMRQVKSHYCVEDIESSEDKPTQTLGAATDKILSDLGLDQAEISQLRERGVIGK